MASAIVIPIIIVAIIGLTCYLAYKLVIYDMMCKKAVNVLLKKYDIRKTPLQIIIEFYMKKGEKISDGKAKNLERMYRQNDPHEFLAMYDAIRER